MFLSSMIYVSMYLFVYLFYTVIRLFMYIFKETRGVYVCVCVCVCARAPRAYICVHI